MANRVGRSPQDACLLNPRAPECATVSNDGAAEQTTAVDDGAVVSTPVPTADVATTMATVDTVLPTTSISTTQASSTPPVFTDPPEALPASGGNSNTSLSAGAVAGIAIGTCIAGAIIAFIAAWLLFKRRDKKFVQKTCPAGYPIYADSSPELVLAQKSAALEGSYVQLSQAQMRTPVPIPSRVSATGDPLASILPPAAGEGEVQNRVAALFDQIHRHVDTFYRDVHASITPSMDSDFAAFGKDVNMMELLQNCSQPTVALKHALLAYILNITSPKQDGAEQTLWPAELTQMLNTNNSDSPHLATAQALHRRLTIHLYTQRSLLSTPHTSSRLSNLSSLSLTRQASSAIREAAEHFSLTFFPWANPSLSEQEREADLAGIITEVLEVRIWMQGQEKEWGFEWEEPGRGVVVLWPGLMVREGGGPRRVVMGQRVVGV